MLVVLIKINSFFHPHAKFSQNKRASFKLKLSITFVIYETLFLYRLRLETNCNFSMKLRKLNCSLPICRWLCCGRADLSMFCSTGQCLVKRWSTRSLLARPLSGHAPSDTLRTTLPTSSRRLRNSLFYFRRWGNGLKIMRRVILALSSSSVCFLTCILSCFLFQRWIPSFLIYLHEWRISINSN